MCAAAVLSGCSHDPIRYIPETDRTMLQSQERLGAGQGSGGPISVDQMLRNAKSSEAKLTDSRVVIRFDGDSVQPDAAQRETLHQFAVRSRAAVVTVTSRPGSFDDAGSPVLGQRRAVAVSRELSGMIADVQVRFEAGLPPGVVVVSLGRPVMHDGAPRTSDP
jgi:hypothetical protein